MEHRKSETVTFTVKLYHSWKKNNCMHKPMIWISLKINKCTEVSRLK